MEEKIKTSKIIINEDSELTDVVREIHKSKAERIILTFTEQTDLLISPINLKVLLEGALREKKLLIAQIIQNPTGIRNAKLAGIKTIDTPSSPTEYDWEDAYEMVVENEKKKKVKKKELEKEEPDEKKKFEEKIVKERSEKVVEKKGNGYVDKRGMKSKAPFISIDEDFPQAQKLREEIPVTQVPTKKIRGFKKTKFSPLGKKKLNILEKVKGWNKKKVIRIALLGLFSLLLILGLGGYLYNSFVPLVKVTIFVEAKGVEIEQVLTGDTDIEEVDFENSLIPIKKESASQSLSDDVTATGKAFKGEKAAGEVNVAYNIGEECSEIEEEKIKLSLSAGHIMSTSGLNFKLVTGAEIICNTITPVNLEAVAIGEEYNVASGKSFSIQGYSSDEVYGLNATAFTGGTKEEYSVLSQTDVDNAVEQLSTTAIEEVKSDLRDLARGWEIIEDSIKSEVDKDSIKTDKSVGQEATTVNLDLSIKGEALYYSKEGLMEALTELLREKAKEENLFNSESELELVLGDDIDTDISIEEIKGDAVKIKIVASSLIKPDIDKTEIQNKLKGMEWEKGKEYIKGLKYSDKAPSIVFQPMKYPEFLKKFPSRSGRVLVKIENYKKDE